MRVVDLSPVAPLGTTTTLDAKLQRITELRLQRMDSVSQLRMDISSASTFRIWLH